MPLFRSLAAVASLSILLFSAIGAVSAEEPIGDLNPDYFAHYTSTIDSETTFGTFNSLGGIAIDRAGRIYQSNFRGTVWRIEPDGTAEVLANGLYGASGNAVLPDGSLLQGIFRSGEILRIDGQGNIYPFAEGLRGPVGIAVSSGGNVFVVNCDRNTISRISADGTDVDEFSADGRLDCPNGVTFGPDGTLYVVNFRNTRVLAFDEKGEARQLTHLPGKGNSHIALLNGSLYVTQIHTHAVFKVELDGTYERVSGNGSRGFADGYGSAATVSYPNGLAVDPSSGTLVFNTLRGPRGGIAASELVLRRLTPPDLLNSLLRAEASGGINEARKVFDAKMEQAGDDIAGFAGRAAGVLAAISNRDKHELATNVAEWLVDLAPEATRVMVLAAEAHDAAGNHDRALALYLRLSELSPDNDDVAKRIEDIRDFR